MIARQSVWNDPDVQKLLEKFVACADEVGYLQNAKNPECELFRRFSEKGHYGGRTKPTNTRQGTYAAAPSGEFLASINSNDARGMAEMLRKALAAWEELPKERRLLADAPAPNPEGRVRVERWYPLDGLALKSYTRDLPREKKGTNSERYFGKAWNQDFLWYRKAESRQWLPEKIEAGAKHDVPAALARRIARFTFVDNVRGQTSAYPDRCVEKAEVAVEVTAVEGDVASLTLTGATRAVEKGKWSIAGFKDMNSPSEQERGVEMKLLGRAKYDVKQEKFVAFEFVAVGTRWGATQYNGRSEDVEPSPWGVVAAMTGDEPADRVAPAFAWGYGWR